MRAKTLVELAVLSSNLYLLAKDTEIMEHVKEAIEKGKDNLNKTMSESMKGEDGEELEFVDRLIRKAGEAKVELEEKIEEAVARFYKKVNIAHLDEIEALKEKLSESDKAIALLEARLNRLEQE